MLLVTVVAQGIGQQEHGLVIHAIVVAGRLFGVFTVIIAVDAFLQILESGIGQILLAEELAALAKQTCNGPAVVGGVEATLQQTSATGVDDLFHTSHHDLLTVKEVFLLAQVTVHGQNDADAESGVGGGEEIAGDVVKQAVFMLGGVHIVKSDQHALENALVMIVLCVLAAVSGGQGSQLIQHMLLHIHAVGHDISAVIGAILVQILLTQRMRYSFFGVAHHARIMCFHCIASL